MSLVIAQSCLATATGTAGAASPTALARTFPTGIDPGVGLFYTYAPSVIQTNPTTRNIFDCENSASDVVHDHVYLSVGHLIHGQWEYGPLKDVFGPEDDPSPSGFFSVHACEPEVIGGDFHFGGRQYNWALLFTAESSATNATNQLGVAFAKNLAGPWKPDLTPIVQTSDDFGHNAFPYNCPTNLYCLGQPAAIGIGSSGHILVTYMSNAGSPGNDKAPSEGLVLRELNLSNVPATGPCPKCFVRLPNGRTVEAVTQAGLGSWPPDDASIAYDAPKNQVVISYDSGPPNNTPDEAPVTPWVSVATINEAELLSGHGVWHLLGAVGSCISGHTLNHNSGLVREPNGDMPNGTKLSMVYTVANHNLHTLWGVWGYRMWDIETPLGVGLSSQASASNNCSGYRVLDSNGLVTPFGSASSSPPQVSAAPVAGMALTPDHRGYYVVSVTGGITRYGDAISQPPLTGIAATANNVIGIAVDQATGGYWVADSNGTVYSSNAPSLGSLAQTPHTGSVVAIAATPAGVGYWLVTSTGEVFPFGHAQNFGGLSPTTRGQTITAIGPTPDGLGYYLLSATGGITIYGDAGYFGPPAVPHLNGEAAAIQTTTDGLGYLILTTAGTVTTFGDAGPSTQQAVAAGQRAIALATS